MANKEKAKETVVSPQNLTQEESAIYQRVMGDDDKSWQTITEGDVEDFSLMEDPLKLPEPAQKQQDNKKFAFRWCKRTSERVDQLRTAPVPKKWWICNSTNTPFLEKFIDPILGCVCRMDQMLLFKPWWMHIKHQVAKREIAEIQDQSGDIKKRHGQKDEKGTQWFSGEDFKISGKDEVVDPGGMLEGAYSQEQNDSSALGDLEVGE